MDIKHYTPLDVPKDKRSEFEKNIETATHGTGRLMLFAGDQKVEHMNDDFYGEGIAPDDAEPEHLFKIASQGKIGVFATQMGLIARYGMDYKEVPYLVKLNSKTHLVKKDQSDPRSPLLYPVSKVVEFKENSGLNILGVGFTVYTGSEFEGEMMRDAVSAVYTAHLNGLFAVLWMYPRGKAVADEKDPHLVAGAAGVAGCIGADFVKVNYPKPKEGDRAKALHEAVVAAGRTRLICAGGSSMEVKEFLQTLHDQIHIAGASGNATGRNIHQKPLDEAIRFANAVSALTYDLKSVDEAYAIYQGK
ncbi:aldolase [Candidatus Gottesmanbacteria bacterium RIFCSPHIGHO2_01_FULL_39_10]|uniref:fructose-bisphosphate aldolase n=1 Tax=Candidatus Gottesmanbacteria bacterium RIFCSPHIGHO2_01_FULL_39_10 TaxID=1798375 RepID=A0A1F5ZQJ3_9BACT|nr:MAG: aldolase [Candidatus Gottesmanbacteria bacterium RIFCSPHIGHO2_01_FULL_39_10]